MWNRRDTWIITVKYAKVRGRQSRAVHGRELNSEHWQVIQCIVNRRRRRRLSIVSRSYEYLRRSLEARLTAWLTV